MSKTSLKMGILSRNFLVFFGILIVVCSLVFPVNAQQPTAMIRSVSGTVLITAQGQPPVNAKQGTTLRAGHVIETHTGAEVVLILSDGSELQLGEETKLDIAVLAQEPETKARRSHLKLWWGKVRSVLSPEHQEEGSSFEVETPNALVGVKFSQPKVEVGFDAQTGETSVKAFTVDMVLTSKKTGRSRTITAGQKATVDKDGNIVIAPMTDAEKATEPEDLSLETPDFSRAQQVAQLIAGAIIVNPYQAVQILTAALQANPDLAVEITAAAVGVAPDELKQQLITAAVNAVPEQAEQIIAAAEAAAARQPSVNASAPDQMAKIVVEAINVNPQQAAQIVTEAVWQANAGQTVQLIKALVKAAPEWAIGNASDLIAVVPDQAAPIAAAVVVAAPEQAQAFMENLLNTVSEPVKSELAAINKMRTNLQQIVPLTAEAVKTNRKNAAAVLTTGAATLVWEQAAPITDAAIKAAPDQAVAITVAVLCAIPPESVKSVTAAAVSAAPEQAAEIAAGSADTNPHLAGEIVESAIAAAPDQEAQIIAAFTDLGLMQPGATFPGQLEPVTIPGPVAGVGELDMFGEFQAINRGIITTTPESALSGTDNGLATPGSSDQIGENRPGRVVIPLEVVEP